MNAQPIIRGIIALCLWWPYILPVSGQFETEPHPLDTFLTSVLDIKKPTGIRGTIRYWEQDQETLWVN